MEELVEMFPCGCMEAFPCDRKYGMRANADADARCHSHLHVERIVHQRCDGSWIGLRWSRRRYDVT